MTTRHRWPAAGLAFAALLTSSLGPAAAQQQPARPNPYPPGPGYAGVAGSAEENARITALCGPNRNATDGYAPPPAFPQQTKAPKAASRQAFDVDVVAKLDRPWGLVVLPDGQMLVTIRSGSIRLIGKDGTVSEPLANVPKIENARLSAIYDLALDRDFARNRKLYFGYITRASAADTTAVGRIASARLSADGKGLEEVRTIYEGADVAPRRIVQARDGSLLITSSIIESGGPNPQSLQSRLGKILRINTDGSIPKDNPFLKDKTANPALYALGFRDIHAGAIDPATGKLWIAENVPMGGDELDLIKPGGNYGFPIISYGRENGGALINGGKTAQEGLEQPVYYWNPSIAPSSVLFYTGKALPGWRGSTFVTALSGKQLIRLEMKGGKVVAEEKLLMDRCVRLKSAQQGPDGLIYLLTDEPKAEVLRIRPK